MSDAAGPRPKRLRAVVLLPRASTGSTVLMGPGPWTLPAVEFERPDDEVAIAAVRRALAGLVGASPVPLRVVPLEPDSADHGSTFLVELAAADRLEPPDGLAWRSLDAEALATLEPRAAATVVARWLAERAAGPRSARPAWSRAGWFERASGWMTERLAEAGAPVVAGPELHALWGLSAVLRAETTAGAAFLKSCASAFREEPAMTERLAAETPDLVPVVVATDRDAGWLLMRDIGQAFVGDEPAERWGDGLAAMATIQRHWVGRDEELLAAGFEDRGLGALARELPRILDEPALDALDAGDRQRLADALPRLIEACDRLGELGPPPSIVHGDLHPWNVARRDGRPIVFDWSDAAVGHPFLDLATWVVRTDDLPARRRMVDQYLAGWSHLLPPDALAEAVRLALPLGAIRQVESYRRILDSLDEDDRWDLGGAGPSYARQAVALLEDGLDAVAARDAAQSSPAAASVSPQVGDTATTRE